MLLLMMMQCLPSIRSGYAPFQRRKLNHEF